MPLPIDASIYASLSLYKELAVGLEPTYSRQAGELTLSSCEQLVNPLGLEPRTNGLKDRYSNQLS